MTSSLPTASDITTSSSISSFTDGGRATFSDTFIAAASVGEASLSDVDTANGGVPFGIAAQSIGSLALLQPRQKPFRYTSKEPASDLATLRGDLRLEIWTG